MVDYLDKAVTGAFSLATAAMLWLIRTVMTNQKQIALLQTEISERDKRREEDRVIMKELHSDVKEVKRDILDLYKNHKVD